MSHPKWITPELINLSKRAKALGFPQDVEEGDWLVFQRRWRNKHADGVINSIYLNKRGSLKGWWNMTSNEFLILSFSRCLEWLAKKNAPAMIGVDLNNFIHGHWIMVMQTKTCRGKNIHECGAKAVVKRLEEA